MTVFMVKAETHEGATVTLRKGFATEEAAQDHPVTLSRWRRVWVEPDSTPIALPKAASLPPFPWDWVAAGTPTANSSFHAYLVDANGKKIAAIWGGNSERKLVADFLVDAANTLNEVENSFGSDSE